MSYELAVWEGDRPADDAAAADIFSRLYDQYVATEVPPPPTEAIQRYVATLLARWPDLSEDYLDSPWSFAPLAKTAYGPLMYFGMSFGMAAEASAYAADAARRLGLSCYDPQRRQLRT